MVINALNSSFSNFIATFMSLVLFMSPVSVWWKQHRLIDYFACLPNSVFSNVRLVAGNWPQ